MDDKYYMELAIEAARESLASDLLPVGAVAVQEGRLLGTGWKRGILHAHLDHAERNLMDTLMNDKTGRENLRGATIFTTLEPCLMCIGEMLNLRVSRAVYAVDDPYGGGTCMLHPDLLPQRHKRDFMGLTSGVLDDIAVLLFRDFFRTTRSKYWKDPENPLWLQCMQGV